MKMCLGWEVVVKYNEWPCSMFALLEWCKTIGGKTECNVPFICKVIMLIFLVTESDLLPAKGPVVRAVKNIGHCSHNMGMAMASILHLLCHGFICSKSLETGDERNVGETFSCSAVGTKTRLFAIRTLLKICVRTYIAAA